MNPRTYQAPTMAEALAAVKRDLGREAVILHTRSFRKGGLLGLIGGRPVWEVTAAPNLNVPPRRAPQGVYVPTAPAPAAEPRPATAVPDELRSQVAEIREMVESLLSRSPGADAQQLPRELAAAHNHLLRQDIEAPLAAELVHELGRNLAGQEAADQGVVRARLREVISARIPTAASPATDPADRRVIALIGPTGVGKTTTIAKLAANFKLREGKRVGLITIDTYRIAAVDQLRTYAEIIEVPIRAVLSPVELQQALAAMSDLDVVLIDTAGRSQNNPLRLNQLREFLSASGASEMHLVVSAASGRKVVCGVLERFLPLGANRVILTKLDEAETFGVVLNVSAVGKTALSYVTTGQEVPDDIAVADGRRLSGWIVGGRMNGY